MRTTGGTGARRVPPRHPAAVAQRVDELLRKFDFPDIDTLPAPAEILGSTGAFAHLLRTSVQTIDVGGEAISWNNEFTTLGQYEFTFEALPVTEVEIPKTGYYDIAVGLEWDDYTAGGSVSIDLTRDGQVSQVAPPSADPGLWTSDNGQRGWWVAKGIPCVARDLITVNVDHNDASSHDLALATLDIELVDVGVGTPETPVDYFATTMALGPIMYWRFDELAADGGPIFDYSGGNFDLDWVSGTSGFESDGVMQDGTGNDSIDFNGGGEAVEDDWPVLDFLNRTPFSVKLWINLEDQSADQNIVHRRNSGGGTGWEIRLLDSGTLLGFARSNGSTTHVVDTAITYGTDYFVVGVYDGDNMFLYLNGVQVDTQASTINLSAPSNPMNIGENSATSGGEVDGRIDEVAIFDYALTADDVALLYQVGTRAAP